MKNQKLKINIIICVFLFVAASCEYQQKNIAPVLGYELIENKLSDAINYEIKSKNLNAISITLVDNQNIVWAQGFGFQDLDNKIPADAYTVYRVGSVSKLFTDLAIMEKVEDGIIDLDAPIQTYLPDFEPNNPYNKPITMRQLMSHRSGMIREPRYGNYFEDNQPSLKKTVQSIVPSTLVYEPESRIKYSNAAIAVVGYTLEYLSGQPYVEYMQKNILDKIGMGNSGFAPNKKINSRLAKANMWSYDGRSFPAPKFELGMIPAGSLYAPVTDLAKFLVMVFNNGMGMNGEVVSDTTFKEMISPQFGGNNKNGYGIGFRLSEHNGYQKIGHGGAIYGFSTQLSALPEKKLGVAVASSVDITNSITTKLTDYALDLMLAKANNDSLPDYQKTGPVDEKTAQLIVGNYDRDGVKAEIQLRGKKLIFITDFLEVPLRKMGNELVSDGRINQGSFKIRYSDNTLFINGKSFERKVPEIKNKFPSKWNSFLGEYGWEHNILFVYEEGGDLWLLMEWIEKDKLTHIVGNQFAFPLNGGMYHGEKLEFIEDKNGNISEVQIIDGPIFKRLNYGIDPSETFRIDPLKSIEELRSAALFADPPKENKEFIEPDLVDLKSLDQKIKYDIRYASTNNFMGEKFYTIEKAYMQRPAAEALVQANKLLNQKGYGLLIYDAYRPWFVTKMFWDATPMDKKIFVANPENGSRHNRGCAVDLTLYDLKTGKVVEMVGGYDEFTARSYPNYYGGRTEQRWHRKLLRDTMESVGFNIYEYEWWHFDYKDWKQYPIGNTRFEDL